MKRIARKEMKDFFKKIYKCRPMSHQNVLKLKVETEGSTSVYLLFREIFFARETPCILQGVFLMQFCNLTTQCTAPAIHS